MDVPGSQPHSDEAAARSAREGNLPVPAEPDRVVLTPPAPDQGFSSWHTEHDWRTAPPVIRLLDAAVKSGIDPTKLLFDIAPDDPDGTAPAVAMVADNDRHRAAEVIAYVAGKGRHKGHELLLSTARLRPFAVLELARILHDEHGFRGQDLVIPALYGCHAARDAVHRRRNDPDARRDAEMRRRNAVADTAYFVVEIYRDRRQEELADVLVQAFTGSERGPDWLTKVDSATAFHATCDVLEELLGNPRHRRVGADLLQLIGKAAGQIATAMLTDVIAYDGGRLRHGRTGEPNLALLTAAAPALTARLFQRCMWDATMDRRQLNALLCQLYRERPAEAVALAAAMLERSIPDLTVIVGETDEALDIAGLLLELFLQRPRATVELLRNWLARAGYIRLAWEDRVIDAELAPVGGITQAMLHTDPDRTVALLRDLATRLPPRRPISLLTGLDEPLLSRTRDLLRRHAGDHWNDLRAFT
ncbi:hypothetical protein Ari01nite_81270 [Paractinoplanes rishiriensis]|uniref:Uncharacterized protein n=1 Tax=Paractinoplanes rishiriensis TaxID=1050105 RepID=A0A919K8F3_9ACTN|nr:hypothetical protein Ari01nite_81270 [Actinoplanes rishiriensis]